MYLLKLSLIALSCITFSLTTFAEEKIAGEKSHNGVSQAMTPDEVSKKIEDQKKLRDVKKSLKADGKYSKEDRKSVRKMKKQMRSADVSTAKQPTVPSKDTQQMIDEADAEADSEDPQLD